MSPNCHGQFSVGFATNLICGPVPGYMLCICETDEMTEVTNLRVVLKETVSGRPAKEDDFVLVESKKLLQTQPGSLDVIIKTLYISCDPYMRERMKGLQSYVPPFTAGEVIDGFVVGKVVKSDHFGFKEGDVVAGFGGWEEYHTVKGGKSIQKVFPIQGVPLSYFIGLLGMPGCTAWYAFFDIAQPRPGDKVFVSSAAGAVGQLVGQFAKLMGCYVVGSVGSDEKVKLLKETFKFDEAFNYKQEPDMEAALKRFFPDGIDIYYENVGGNTLDAALANMNDFGRIPVCGMISQYNLEKKEPIYNAHLILKKRLAVKGFIILDQMADSNFMKRFYSSVGSLIQQQKLVYVEDVAEGLANAPAALVGVMEGKNVGKQVVKIADP